MTISHSVKNVIINMMIYLKKCGQREEDYMITILRL